MGGFKLNPTVISCLAVPVIDKSANLLYRLFSSVPYQIDPFR